MYIVRSASIDDLNELYELSSLMTFINLPNDKIELEEMLEASEKSFSNPSPDKEDNVYIFVLEDDEKKNVLGVSVIHARHGTEKHPHYFMKVGNEQKYCNSLNTGFIHGTLKLGVDNTGYTEIGGLVLHPDLRASGDKLGKQVSFGRFLYMAGHMNEFCELTHSELMPPFDHEGKSPLWEAIGRRFLNMDYYDADKLSRKNPEFILSLFPSDNIYQTLLPVEAREAVGKVGKSTLPVKNMLEKLGFVYTNEVDPFDGGPHYRCATKEIKAIRLQKSLPLSTQGFKEENAELRLVQIPSAHRFCCVRLKMVINDQECLLEPGIAKKLGLNDGVTLLSIPCN